MMTEIVCNFVYKRSEFVSFPLQNLPFYTVNYPGIKIHSKIFVSVFIKDLRSVRFLTQSITALAAFNYKL